MQVLHVVLARGFEIDQHRNLASDLVEAIEIDPYAASRGDRGQMDQRVARAADRLQDDQRIADRLGGEQLGRSQGRCCDRRRARAGRFRQPKPLGVHRRYRRRARKRDAQHLGDAGHGAGGTHHGTGA